LHLGGLYILQTLQNLQPTEWILEEKEEEEEEEEEEVVVVVVVVVEVLLLISDVESVHSG
jgi:hypothetical protein